MNTIGIQHADIHAAPSTADADARRLVLGAAVGFRVDQVRVFVESLRAVGYRGDIVMLVGLFQPRLKAYLARHGVETMSSWSTRKLHGPIHAYRFEKFARIAAARAARYDAVLISDVRDVVFQKHPFAGLDGPACRYFLEGADKTIAEEPTNYRWAKTFLSADEVARIAPCRITCCGVVIGGMAPMRDYLAIIARQLHDLPLALRREGGADTVFHNRLAHLTREVEGVLVENNLHVATLGLEGEDAYHVGADGLIHARDGALPAIVHQYDRIPKIDAAVATRFPAS